MIVYQRTGESNRQHAIREFNWCMYQVDRCYMLQTMRQARNDRGTAIFYQLEARRWHILAMRCRARYKAIVAELIPGTDVKWRDVFGTMSDAWADVFALLPWKEQSPDSKIVMEPKYATGGFIGWDAANQPRFVGETSHPFNAGLTEQSIGRSQRTAQTPREKYNDPRDAPATLQEQMKRLLERVPAPTTNRCKCDEQIFDCQYPNCKMTRQRIQKPKNTIAPTICDCNPPKLHGCDRCKIKRIPIKVHTRQENIELERLRLELRSWGRLRNGRDGDHWRGSESELIAAIALLLLKE